MLRRATSLYLRHKLGFARKIRGTIPKNPKIQMPVKETLIEVEEESEYSRNKEEMKRKYVENLDQAKDHREQSLLLAQHIEFSKRLLVL